MWKRRQNKGNNKILQAVIGGFFLETVSGNAQNFDHGILPVAYNYLLYQIIFVTCF